MTMSSRLKVLNFAVGAVFLIVGIVATTNMIRINHYIAETLPRDIAQETCNAATLEVLKSWSLARVRRDAAMNSRDDATIVVLDRLIDGERPTVEELRKWRNAVAYDRHVRTEAAEARPALPHCTVGISDR
jgi:hypothetical protein